MGKIIVNGEEYSGTRDSATSVNYDNSVSGLSAGSVQEGIDELAEGLKNTSVVDNLLSTSTTLPLSANQGRLLNERLEWKSLGQQTLPVTIPSDANEIFLIVKTTGSGNPQMTDILPIIALKNLGGNPVWHVTTAFFITFNNNVITDLKQKYLAESTFFDTEYVIVYYR